jgi:hypothetical protein
MLSILSSTVATHQLGLPNLRSCGLLFITRTVSVNPPPNFREFAFDPKQLKDVVAVLAREGSDRPLVGRLAPTPTACIERWLHYIVGCCSSGVFPHHQLGKVSCRDIRDCSRRKLRISGPTLRINHTTDISLH